MAPPGVIENFAYDLTPDELLKKTEHLIADCRELYDKVAGVKESDISFETVLKVRLAWITMDSICYFHIIMLLSLIKIL